MMVLQPGAADDLSNLLKVLANPDQVQSVVSQLKDASDALASKKAELDAQLKEINDNQVALAVREEELEAGTTNLEAFSKRNEEIRYNLEKQQSDLKAREDAANQKEKDNDTISTSFVARERMVSDREKACTDWEARLNAQASDLNTARAALDTKLAAFKSLASE